MPGVFVSHAAVDKRFVDNFMDDIIRLGCEVPKTSIFYSSGADTGIPSGGNLNAYVRQKVQDATIVVAILTPSFQTRPYCAAELGAAWSRTGLLFPIAAPGVERTDLQGVLKGLIVRYLDDSGALDELHEAVCGAVGTSPGATTWNMYKAKWLSKANRLAASLEIPRLITPEEFERVQSDAQGALDALGEAQSEIEELKAQIEQLKVTKDAVAVRQITKPKTETAEYEQLEQAAREALSQLPPPAREAVFWDMKKEDMPWPNAYEDQWAYDQTEKARVDGWLTYGTADDSLRLNRSFGKVVRAVKAVQDFRRFLSSDERSEEFHEWFSVEYDEVPPDLDNKFLWDQIFDLRPL
jgi:hypothetical protein